MVVRLLPNEVVILQRLWNDFNFMLPSKSLIPGSSSLRYDQQAIEDFLQVMIDVNELGFGEDLTVHFPFLIQIFTMIVASFDAKGNGPKNSKEILDLIIKFAKINGRIYHLNYQQFGDCLLETILTTRRVSNLDQAVLIKFLNQVLNQFESHSEDPILEFSDYRLSYSDSNLSSNLSLNNEDMDSVINDNVSLMTVNKKLADSDRIDTASVRESIDIDELENIDEHFDNVTLEDEDDDAFDYLNAFTAPETKKKDKKKSNRRLSSINLKSSKNNLSRVPTNSSKQECTIM